MDTMVTTFSYVVPKETFKSLTKILILNWLSCPKQNFVCDALSSTRVFCLLSECKHNKQAGIHCMLSLKT